ncbi:hypothetical protein F5Y16DRAFT_391774 [Xylariaceae sp. FL0255]|nr:hypothetical protein F5Y16DRAFT_391774 [Xylariaceae sp. FL0255]
MAEATRGEAADIQMLDDPFIETNAPVDLRRDAPRHSNSETPARRRTTASKVEKMVEMFKQVLNPIILLAAEEGIAKANALWTERRGELAARIADRVNTLANTAATAATTKALAEGPVTRSYLDAALMRINRGLTSASAFAPAPRTWAQAAAGAWKAPNAVAIPARRSKEVIIKAGKMDQTLKNRRPVEIVSAVNAACKTVNVIAAKKLFSGDIVVTFKEKVLDITE